MRSKISFLIAFQILFVFLCYSTGFSEEGIKWGRFRFMPALSFSEQYTDNIFLAHEDIQNEYITTVAPKLSLNFAFAPENFITLNYESDFRFYEKSENFKKDVHRTGISWTWNAPKGSKFKLGAKADFDSIQPYSEEDRHKDFVKREAFVDTLFKLGSLTELGVKYDYQSRRFKERIDEIDDFDRNTITLNITYWLFPLTALLMEYSYYHQNNPDIDGISLDMNTHTVFIGARWDPTAKLSGVLKAGYTTTDFKEIDDFSGFAADTDLTYKFSDITTFKLTAFHMLVRSTAGARETGVYYISKGGGISATYIKWDPLKISMNLTYTNNNFEQQTGLYEDRKDDVYTVGLKAKYLIKDWLTSTLSYHYRRNKSTVKSEDYKENRAELLFSISI